MRLAMDLDAGAADWLVRRARLLGATPESVAETMIESAAQTPSGVGQS
jgi:hypothetical protein